MLGPNKIDINAYCTDTPQSRVEIMMHSFWPPLALNNDYRAENLTIQPNFKLYYYSTLDIFHTCRHVKSLTLCRDEDLLSMVNRDGQSGVNFAMKLGKARRANMILEVSKCKNNVIH